MPIINIYSSKNTSINTTRLPAIYNKVDWSRYTHPIDNWCVIDFGCGRMETQRLISKKLKEYNITQFYPYDPYHKCMVSKKQYEYNAHDPNRNKVIVCSNVLNVINNDDILQKIIAALCNMIVTRDSNGIYHMQPCYISVYEGDKSGVGRVTKKDCWQRNERLGVYLKKFNDYIKEKYGHSSDFFTIKYGMIVGCTQYSFKRR